MSRTTKIVRGVRGLQAPTADKTRSDAARPLSNAATAQFFEGEFSAEKVVRAPTAVDQPAPSLGHAAAGDDVSRLRDLLDRAGDPAPIHREAQSDYSSRRAAGRWRNDPHVLGRAAGVLFVLLLAAACVAAALQVNG